MDALLFNIPTNGPGASPRASGEAAPEGADTAFAEALSAAMAASMQTAVKSDQQGQGKILEGDGGQLLAALKGSGSPGAQPDPLANVGEAARNEASTEGLEPGLVGQGEPPDSPPDRTASSNGLLAPESQVAGVDGTRGPAARDASGAVGAAERTARSPAAPLAVMTAEPLIAERSQAGLHVLTPSTRQPVVSPHLESTPVVQVDPDRPAEIQPVAVASPSTSATAATRTAALESPSIVEPSDPRVRTHEANLLTTRPSTLEQAAQAPQQAVANFGRSVIADPNPAAASGMTEPSDARPQPAQAGVQPDQRSPSPTLDPAGQRDLAQLLAARPDRPVPSSPRPSPPNRSAQPLGEAVAPQTVTGDASTLSHQGRPQNVPSLDQPAQRVPTTASDAGQRPDASVVQALGPNQAAQASPVEDAALVGADRFQTVLAADGALIDGDPFEPSFALGSTRSSGTPVPTAPGAQIGLQIARSLANGVERLTVHLHPAELGSVDVQLNFEDTGRLTAQIVAERPETLELLQRDSRLLERSLGDSGLKLSNDGLSFSLKQDQQQQQAGQQFQDQGGSRQSDFRAGRAYDDAPNTEEQPLARRIDGLRLLDIET
jgi:flagellar hook-length control protein FliK